MKDYSNQIRLKLNNSLQQNTISHQDRQIPSQLQLQQIIFLRCFAILSRVSVNVNISNHDKNDNNSDKGHRINKIKYIKFLSRIINSNHQ